MTSHDESSSIVKISKSLIDGNQISEMMHEPPNGHSTRPNGSFKWGPESGQKFRMLP